MSEVSYHAWTHKPKTQGGTDPLTGLEVKYIVCKDINTTQVFAPGSSDVLWQVNVNAYPECFEPLDVDFNPDFNRIKFLEAGLFTTSCTLALTSAFDHDWQLSIWTVDPTSGVQSHRTMRGLYETAQGQPDASLTWTHRMAINEQIEFQFVNLNPTEDIETTFTGGCFIEVYKWPGFVTMTGRDRDTSPG